MKCPKCGYVSHDYLDACRKCGRDLIAFKREVGLQVIRPGDLDLSLVLSGSAAAGGNREDFNLDADFFGRQLFGQGGAVEADEAQFDISLDDDLPMPPTTASPAPSNMEVAGGDDTMANQPRPAAATEHPTAADLTVDLIDMSDLEDTEATARDLATPPMSETLALGETPEATRAEPQEKAPGIGAPETVSDLGTDDFLEADLELEFEDMDEGPRVTETEPELLIDLGNVEPRDDDEQNNPPPPKRT